MLKLNGNFLWMGLRTAVDVSLDVGHSLINALDPFTSLTLKVNVDCAIIHKQEDVLSTINVAIEVRVKLWPLGQI